MKLKFGMGMQHTKWAKIYSETANEDKKIQ